MWVWGGHHGSVCNVEERAGEFVRDKGCLGKKYVLGMSFSYDGSLLMFLAQKPVMLIDHFSR